MEEKRERITQLAEFRSSPVGMERIGGHHFHEILVWDWTIWWPGPQEGWPFLVNLSLNICYNYTLICQIYCGSFDSCSKSLREYRITNIQNNIKCNFDRSRKTKFYEFLHNFWRYLIWKCLYKPLDNQPVYNILRIVFLLQLKLKEISWL